MSSISITSEAQAEHVEHLSRLFARRVALGLALSRADLTAAARAAGRIRLPELGLSADERNAARYTRATIGRAIRDARARNLRAPIVRRAYQPADAVAPRRRGRLAIAAALAVAAVVVVFILFLGTPGGPLTGIRASGNTSVSSSQQVLDATKESRGRTGKFSQPVAVGAPSGTPAPLGTPDPAPEREDIHGGRGGGGGGGGGSGTGGVGIVPLPPIVPPPSPTPAVYVRFHGRVVDAASGAGIAGVCVVIGSLNCGPDKPHTDAQGFWSVVVTSQPYWDFGWQVTNYKSVLERLYSYGRDDVAVPDVKLSR